MSNNLQTFDDVIFRCGGRLYSSAELIRHETGDPENPALFITIDGSQTFMASINSIGIMSIRELAPAELATLAQKLQLNLVASRH